MEVNKEGCAALQEYFSSCSVIITSENLEFEHGTGVAVRYKSEYYIITAAHVLDQERHNHKLRLIAKPDSVLKEVARDDLPGAFFSGTHGSIKHSCPSPITIIDRLKDSRLGDIAALQVQPTNTELPNTQFHDLSSQGQANIFEGMSIVICGFPGALAQHAEHRATGQLAAITTNYCAYQHVRSIPETLNQLDPTIHFLTDFLNEGKILNPKGMSGGGAWSVPGVTSGDLWFPGQTKLLGIQSAFSREQQLLVLVRIERVLDLLSSK